MAANYCSEKLSPLDLVMPATYIRVLLTFRTTSSIDIIYDGLNRGLAGTAAQVPWITGRLFHVPSGTAEYALEVRWDAHASPPRIANRGTIATTYDSLSAGGMDAAAIPSELWPVSAIINEKEYETGVVAFSAGLFRFADDQGVGLCVCAHHNATDINGLTELLRLWSGNIASNEINKVQLITGRCDLLTDALANELSVVASKPLEELFNVHPEYSRMPPQLPTTFSPLTSIMYKISVASLNAMKDQLRGHMQTPPTTNTILCGSLWAAITLARMQRGPTNSTVNTSRLVMAVNGRPRLCTQSSSSGPLFLGNLILYSIAQVSFDELLSFRDASSKRIAKVFDVIAASYSPSRINSRHIAEVYNLVERIADKRTIFPGWDLFNRRDLTITSWANLDLYNLNFGDALGKPEFVRVPYSDADGVCLILPRKQTKDEGPDKGAIEVTVMLNKDDMEALKQLDFWQGLTI